MQVNRRLVRFRDLKYRSPLLLCYWFCLQVESIYWLHDLLLLLHPQPTLPTALRNHPIQFAFITAFSSLSIYIRIPSTYRESRSEKWEREHLKMAKEKYIVEVEPGKPAKDGKPSIGPVYRSIFAKDGFPAPIAGLDSCWDIFRFDFLLLSTFVPKFPTFCDFTSALDSQKK